MEIRVDDLTDQRIIDLLHVHLQGMTLHSPPESIHALDLGGLRRPEITFWTAWDDEELLGFGALKVLDPHHGEIKSMHTAAAHRQKGVARRLVEQILEEATRRRYTRLSLETGSMEAFEPARRLYSQFGFKYCGPFADYVLDPYSVFMTREI
jgi:putative acetyltransferase